MAIPLKYWSVHKLAVVIIKPFPQMTNTQREAESSLHSLISVVSIVLAECGAGRELRFGSVKPVSSLRMPAL